MKRQTRFLLIISVVAVIGIIVLQLVWLSNYFSIHKDRFAAVTEKSVLTALIKERAYRNDQLENKLLLATVDTSVIRIRSKWLAKYRLYQHLISSAKDSADIFYYSHNKINFAAGTPESNSYKKVAAVFARFYRTENIDKGTIDYTPEAIGFYADALVKAYPFDSTSFHRALKEELEHQSISTDFVVSITEGNRLRKTESASWFTQMSSAVFPVNTNGSRVINIQVLFQLPYTYLLQKMLALLIGSVLLIVITGYCFYRILRSLYMEKKLSAVKNDFISNITHEFKTPIATVTAAMEALEDFGAYDKPEKRKKYFKTARQEINRLSEMVNKILNISIYEKKDIEIKKTMINPITVVQEIIDNYEMIQTKKIEWIFIHEVNLHLRADKELLHIALSNVIDNAIKYSLEPVKVKIEIKQSSDTVSFIITDNGIGIKAENIPFVFEKFYRINAGEQRIKGYGLGLSYTQSILEAHKGSAAIQSVPGEGSVFTLNFPV